MFGKTKYSVHVNIRLGYMADKKKVKKALKPLTKNLSSPENSLFQHLLEESSVIICITKKEFSSLQSSFKSVEALSINIHPFSDGREVTERHMH